MSRNEHCHAGLSPSLTANLCPPTGLNWDDGRSKVQVRKLMDKIERPSKIAVGTVRALSRPLCVL